jgi:hypothetical protein
MILTPLLNLYRICLQYSSEQVELGFVWPPAYLEELLKEIEVCLEKLTPCTVCSLYQL